MKVSEAATIVCCSARPGAAAAPAFVTSAPCLLRQSRCLPRGVHLRLVVIAGKSSGPNGSTPSSVGRSAALHPRPARGSGLPSPETTYQDLSLHGTGGELGLLCHNDVQIVRQAADIELHRHVLGLVSLGDGLGLLSRLRPQMHVSARPSSTS